MSGREQPNSAPDDEPLPSPLQWVPARGLRVAVTSLPIEDGQRPPPAVGDIGVYALTFHEVDPHEDDAAAAWRDVLAEPLNQGVPLGPARGWDGVEQDGSMVWPTLLRGEGWTAYWRAPRPVVGRTRLHGLLSDDLDIDAHDGVRGRILRVQLITETSATTHATVDVSRSGPGVRFDDVAVAPRWFDHGLIRDPAAPPTGWAAAVPAEPRVAQTGVLVDLDLDDVPALPRRPRLVPGALAACGTDLWIVDERLPLLVRLRRPLDAHPEVTEFPWPGRILTPDEAPLRALHADPDGCWITGHDGVHRVDALTGVVQVDTRPADRTPLGAPTTSAGVLAVAVYPATTEAPTTTGGEPHRVLRRWTRGGDTGAELDLGPGAVEALGAHEGGFLALRRRHVEGVGSVRTREPTWLTSISNDATVTHGPYLGIAGTLYTPLLPGDRPIVDDSRARKTPDNSSHCPNGPALRRVRDDLTVDSGVPWARRLLGGYAAAGRFWVLMHPPQPTEHPADGADVCWPLTAPLGYPDDRQYWLLTELDPTSLRPLIGHLVPRRPIDVAVDGTGSVWLIADGLRHLPPSDGDVAARFDLSALLEPGKAPDP